MTTQAQTQVNSATGIVGPTGAGKSSLIATAAEYCWETYQQVMLYYNFSGGGFPAKIQSLQRLGVIRLWRGRTRGEPFETTTRAAKGWWPSRINPSTGETAPAVTLVPPITQRFTLKCPNGHVVKVVPFSNLLTPALCPTCKVHTSLQNGQVEREMHRTKGFEQVGAVAFDDLTSMLNWQMDDMASRHARQEIKGEETAVGGRITSGDVTLGGNNRSHYGFVQTRASEMVHDSMAIPFLQIPPLWAMLMLETVDEGGLPVKGPKLAGKAKTDEAPSWFGNMLEVAVVKHNTDEPNSPEVRRLYLNEFIDEGGYRHLVKHRGTPRMPPYLQDSPNEPWSQVHLGAFFELLAQDVATEQQAQAAKYTNAPGMPGEDAEYGEPLSMQTPSAPAPQAQTPAQPGVAQATPAPPAPRPKAPTPRAPRPQQQGKVVAAPAPPAVAAPVVTQEEEPPLPLEAPAPVADVPVTIEPGPVVAESAAAAPVPETPVAGSVAAPVALAAPVAAAPRMAPAPPPGPRPPAPAPRRPRAATPPPVPVGAKP